MLLLATSSSTRITPKHLKSTPYPTIINSNAAQTENITSTPAASRNIEIISPLIGDIVKSGFNLKGNARVFEGVVSIRLLDSQGNTLKLTTTQTNAPDAGFFGPFNKTIDFQTTDTTGTLEVYQVSAKDGSEIDKVTIPLQFSQ